MNRFVGRGTMLGALLAVTACGGDPQAAENAAAEARAAAEANRQASILKDRLAHNVQCLSAIRWQEAALRSADIGDLDVDRDYFRGRIADQLGDATIPAEPPRPELSAGNLDGYLDWAYSNDVDTVFAAGNDANGDGEVSAEERSGRGFMITASCIQEAAEMGEGPLAGIEKTDRAFRIQALRQSLTDKGA